MFRRLLPFLLAVSGLFPACNKYKPYADVKPIPAGNPDYAQLDYWAAHPWKQDPSDSVPAPLRNETRDSVVDVFFMHPTTYTSLKSMKGDYAEFTDEKLNHRTDKSTILFQASAFNQHARVFAPRYRQAHISMFYTEDKQRAAAAFDTAYADLKNAFITYLRDWNQNRPFIIAAHSQGSFLGERLLKEFFDDPQSPYYALRDKLVAAYMIGWPLGKDQFSNLSVCRDSLQTGCICSWRTLRKGYIPPYMKKEKGDALVTNPLNWKTGTDYAPRSLNTGSVLTNFNRIDKQTTDAQIHNGMLWVRKPRFPFSFLYTKRNYHIADINLYYLSLRHNIGTRIREWKNSHRE